MWRLSRSSEISASWICRVTPANKKPFRLLIPARALSQVIGLSHPPHFEKTAEVLRMLACPRALVVSGVEGDPELSVAGLTRVLELREERITPLSFASRDVGMPLGTPRDMAGFPSDQREK